MYITSYPKSYHLLLSYHIFHQMSCPIKYTCFFLHYNIDCKAHLQRFNSNIEDEHLYKHLDQLDEIFFEYLYEHLC